MTRKSVLKWAGMKDPSHQPREAVITDDAKAWVVHLACCKPRELGYAAELWTRSALARHVRVHALQAGYPALDKAARATVQRILDAQPLHPHKVRITCSAAIRASCLKCKRCCWCINRSRCTPRPRRKALRSLC
jgi:uncharacterized protein YwbE